MQVYLKQQKQEDILMSFNIINTKKIIQTSQPNKKVKLMANTCCTHSQIEVVIVIDVPTQRTGKKRRKK